MKKRDPGELCGSTEHDKTLNSAQISPEIETQYPVVDTGVCKVQTQLWLFAQGDELWVKDGGSSETLLCAPTPPLYCLYLG